METQQTDKNDLDRFLSNWNKEKNELIGNPPVCNAIVQYQQEMMSGIFHFSAQELLETINFEVNLILENWLLNHSTNKTEPTKIPESILKFIVGDIDDIVNQLIKLDVGFVYCSRCSKNIPYNNLTKANFPLHGGYNYNYLQCSDGHSLLRTKAIHIFGFRKN